MYILVGYFLHSELNRYMFENLKVTGDLFHLELSRLVLLVDFRLLSMSKFDVIPIIDYSNFADPSSKEQELEKLKEAIFEIGFLYLINTGIEVKIP